jgi:hypothetical protein
VGHMKAFEILELCRLVWWLWVVYKLVLLAEVVYMLALQLLEDYMRAWQVGCKQA